MLKPNEKYYRLTVIKHDYKDARWRNWYLFKCDCGVEKVLHGSSVISGNTKSCGCLSRENHAKRASMAKSTKQGAKTAIFLQYKRHAKSRSIPFDLTKNQLITISQRDCHYCGQSPSNLKKTKHDQEGLLYSGVDRWDNKKGYTLNNCQPCCKICNYAKRNMSYADFELWIIRTYKHLSAMAEQWG